MALRSSFYSQPTPDVAIGLLGKVLAIWRDGRWVGGTIVETEAYLADGDPASHSYRGPTPRSAIMFGRPGVAYVYFVYGMHHCLNAVTEADGRGAAVLIRALAPEVPEGLGVAPIDVAPGRLRGPGRICRELGVTLAMNGWDLTTDGLRVLDAPRVEAPRVLVGPRVGINRAQDLLLRFRVGPAAAEPGRGLRSSGRRPSS